MTQAIKAFLEADALLVEKGYVGSRIAPDLAKMVDDMRLAKEALAQAKRAINGREHTGFIDKALTRLKPYEKLFEKEGGE